MDKTEFCYRLQEAFSSLRDRNLTSVMTEYDTVLTGDIDFQNLYNTFMGEWDKNFRPMPSDLKPFIQRARIHKQMNVSNDVKADLFMVTKWFNSSEFQRYRKPIPDHIRMTKKQHNFSDELINNTMVSDEFWEWLQNEPA